MNMMKGYTLTKLAILFILLHSSQPWDYLPIGPQTKAGLDPPTTNNSFTIIYLFKNYTFIWVAFDGTNSYIYMQVFNFKGNHANPFWKIRTPIQLVGVRTASDNTNGFLLVTTQQKQSCSQIYIRGVYFDNGLNFNQNMPTISIISPTTCVKYSPSVVFADNSFIVCYNGILQRLTIDHTLNAINNDVYNDTFQVANSTENNYCEMIYLKNGNVAVVYQATVNSVNKIQYAIVRESDLSAIKTLTLIETNSSYPTISLLITTPLTFVITWLDTSGAVESIVAQIYDINGNPLGSLKVVKSVSQAINPVVYPVSNDGFVILYSVGTSMFYQYFNNDGGGIGNERQIVGADTIKGNPFAITGNPGYHFLFGFFSQTYFSGQMFYNETYFVCSNLAYIVSKQNPKVLIELNNGINFVYLNTLPSIGILMTKDNLILDANSPALLINNVYYSANQMADLDSFYYTYEPTKPQCKVTITFCYISCYSCTIVGDIDNHQCTLCDTTEGYYPLVDNSSMCYQAKNLPAGYLLDNNIWKRCYIACKTCNSYPIDLSVDMGCTSCVDGYYPKEENPTSCFQGNIEHYFFNGSMYRKCFNLCKSCTGYPTNYLSDMLCESNSCISGYYPKIDNMSNCFYDNIPGYYFDGSIYQRCYSSCATCDSTHGTDDNHQCLTCIIDYFPKVDKLTSCFTDNQETYFFDDAIYQKCYPSCRICTNLGTITDHKCLKCLDYYYPKSDNLTSCFTGEQEGYTFNGKTYQRIDIIKTTTISCNPSPCLNSGACSLSLNKVKCECANNFTGSLCQYDINNLNVDELVDNYFNTKSDQNISDLMSVVSKTNSTTGFDKLYDSLGIYLLKFSF
jgi:hypothetical protein